MSAIPAASPRIDVNAHLGWAAAIALRIARSFRFQSDESADLVQVAHLMLCRKAASAAFDAQGLDGNEVVHLFRGWAGMSIRGECRREAKRLRNGGTYYSRKEQPGMSEVHVTHLSELETPGGDGIPLVDYRSMQASVAEAVNTPQRGEVDLMSRLFA